MESLKVTEQEAIEIWEEDDRIDHNEKLYELSKEKEKISREMRNIKRSPAETPNKRKQETNNTKIDIINTLIKAANGIADSSCEVEHPERIFKFRIDNTLYKVTLSTPRE